MSLPKEVIAKQLFDIRRNCRCCNTLMHFNEGRGSGLCTWCIEDAGNVRCICNGYNSERELKQYDELEDSIKIAAIIGDEQ